MLFKGSCVALVTPFDESEKVNYFVLKRLIEFQIANGTKAICVLGTTGEGATITFEEREKIIKFCSCLISKRVPLIVGICSNSTSFAIKEAKQAEQFGADAVLTVTPHYNKCNQTGLFEHFRAVAGSVKIPIILYNVPSRTGVNMLPSTVLKLSKIKNIIAVKEASGNLLQLSELLQILPKDFAVYSGDDMLALPAIALGASGVISVTANAYPEYVSYLCEYANSGDMFNARRMHDLLYRANQVLFEDINPICIKHFMNLLGLNVGKPRLPLTAPTSEVKKKLWEVFKFYEN